MGGAEGTTGVAKARKAAGRRELDGTGTGEHSANRSDRSSSSCPGIGVSGWVALDGGGE